MEIEEFITKRTKIISEMLDNPDNIGIYPTTKCFEQLDKLFEEITDPKWISVKDRLPENSDKDLNDMPLNFSAEVLVFGDKIPSVGFYDFELKKWLFSEDETIYNVTHWMPLPETPK